MTTGRRPDVLIAVPARNESDTIETTLEAVIAATQEARSSGLVDRVRVAVAAHRCSDDTAAVAKACLRSAEVDHLVSSIEDEVPVGLVRTRLVHAAVAQAPVLEPERTWLLSTDADSVVPRDWVSALVGKGERTGATLLAGLTSLVGWEADAEAHAAYRRLLAAGMQHGTHAHLYAANLAVRLDVFLSVGGFPGLPHGEEHGLAAALRERGDQVLGVLNPVVATSARMPGRAGGGLGALLAELDGSIR